MDATYDAVVVGSGPNGLSAAIVLQKHGLKVLLIEGKETIGGGMRTMELTLPGFHHDVCSAIHPMAGAGPFFKTLPLAEYGLEYIHPKILAGHPLPDGRVASLHRSLSGTADQLGSDSKAYIDLLKPLVDHWDALSSDFLAPLKIPNNPIKLGLFGINALQPATLLARKFKETSTRALWAGMAAHGIQPLTNVTTSAIAMVLMAAGHHSGWPMIKGGSQTLADSLTNYFVALGGTIEKGKMIADFSQIPDAKLVMFDVSPKNLLNIAGDKFSKLYRWQLNRYRYGMGVFKMDFALSQPIPWKSTALNGAGTVHLGGTIEDISKSEKLTWEGKYSQNPFVLLAQQSLFDKTRSPEGSHTAWAYCHVPSGSEVDMSAAIENQIEKYAPGFKETIIGKHTFNTKEIENYNPNYIGGDINAGVQDWSQLFTRPALRISPYRTSFKNIYICSASTPPGGGVHGMGGYYAAKRAIKDLF
ncbi:phytoene desaturase family protein [Cyclobacterium qasimii]|uniref:FAD-dependent oxidoreductase n=1 Tax=Cyclobacterium qasimii TaxID=1350429 RepID=A0A512CDV1_9BACT|nr:NAD(P)/FAD-dependent oxidoreductase [Cyclobacterium qasimii]GEO22388.1 FAD-dependent oxidoreductase [Cyclobacterium qasimii]